MTQVPRPFYLIFGNDEYDVAANSRTLIDQLCPREEQPFSLDLIEGHADTAADAAAIIRRCMEALCTVGLFGNRNVVWLKDANFFSGAPLGRAGETKQSIERLVNRIKQGISSDHVLVISTSKVDKRSTFYKTFTTVGEVQEYQAPDKAYQIESKAKTRIKHYFQERKLKIREEALSLLLERAGTETRQLMLEAEKLATYMGERQTIQVGDIQHIVSPAREAFSWELADAVGNGRVKEALHILRQLVAQKASDIGIVMGLENHIRLIMALRECMDRGWVSVESRGRWQPHIRWLQDEKVDEHLSSLEKDPRSLHPYRAGKLFEQAKRVTLDECIHRYEKIVRTHEKMVTTSLPSRLLLELLLLNLSKRGLQNINAMR